MGEYALLNDYNVFKLPDSVSDEQGALVEPAAVTVTPNFTLGCKFITGPVGNANNRGLVDYV